MTTMIDLSGIEFDETSYVRAALNEALVSEYAERMKAGDPFPPVVVFDDGGHRRLSDGRTRILAAQRNGAPEIAAEIRQGTQAEAIWFALGANRAHGARMTQGDLPHAVQLALSAFPDRSPQVIADQIGCSRSYVERIKREAEDDRHPEQVATSSNLPKRVVGKDGKRYPARRLRRPSAAGSEPPRPRGRGTLRHLQRYWSRATQAERQEFLDWTRLPENRSAPDEDGVVHEGAGSLMNAPAAPATEPAPGAEQPHLPFEGSAPAVSQASNVRGV